MSSETAAAGNRSIWRSATQLISGTVASQAIQFAASLILARLFVPAEFGLFAAALGVATVMGVLIVLSYPSAIPLAATDEEARTLTWVSLALALALSTPILAVLFVVALTRLPVLGSPIDYWYALFVPLVAAALAIFSTMQMQLSRHGEFRSIGQATAVGALVQVAVQLGLGYAGFGAAGLALGYLLGRVANVALMTTKARLGRPPGRVAMSLALRSWSGRTRWLLVTSTMNLLGTAALAPWVHLHYDDEVAGSFAFALMTLSVPAALIGQAMSTILFPRMAAAERSQSLAAENVYAYVIGLTSIAFPLFLPVLILGSDLFQAVYGLEWKTAGLIATLLAPLLAVGFVSSPVSSVALVQGKYKHTTVLATVDATLRLVAIAVGGHTGSVALGFALYSFVGVVFYVSYIAWIMTLVGGNLMAVIRSTWKISGLAVVAAVALLLVRPVVPLGVLVALTGVVCLVAVWRAIWRHLPGRETSIA